MFVQSQALAWDDDDLTAIRGKVQSKILSRDAESGALTAVLRYPAGWNGNGFEALGVEEELLVLDGNLSISGVSYERYGYACLPAGFERTDAASDNGAVVLTMFAGAPELTGPIASASSRLISFPSIFRQGLEAWTENPYTRYLLGTGVFPLREDPDTGEISILYAALPFRLMEKRWTHKYVQEMYVLSGEYAINDAGVMSPGAYAWWEPEFKHGPYGSLSGFMMFIRSVGGPLENIIDDKRVAVDYDAAYRPVLPENMQAMANELRLQKNY